MLGIFCPILCLVLATSLQADLAVHECLRCSETGSFRFVFSFHEGVVAADLTVCDLEEKNLAFLLFITVDRVYNSDLRIQKSVEAWVAANQDIVWTAALEVAP